MPPAWAADGFFARAETLTYSEPVSIDTALKSWKGPFYGGDAQWSANWVEAGYRRGKWSISALYRRDFRLDFSPDTAELYYRVRHRLPLQNGRRYALDITTYSFSALGARGSFRHEPLPGLSLAWGVSLFNASDLLEGSLSGYAKALADKDYSYDAFVDYVYDEDKLFERPVDAPGGIGASLDLDLAYRLSAQMTLRARVVDLLGVIRWQDVPYTRATAVSDRQGFDDEGYIIVEPAISGIEGYHASYSQQLEPRVYLQLESAIGDRLSASLQYRYLYGMGLFGLGASTPWREGSLGVLVWPALAAVGLEVRRHGFTLGLTLDDIQHEDIRTLWLSLGINTGP